MKITLTEEQVDHISEAVGIITAGSIGLGASYGIGLITGKICKHIHNEVVQNLVLITGIFAGSYAPILALNLAEPIGNAVQALTEKSTVIHISENEETDED